jgi:ABC-type transport system involved in multi-copper enzyme maturation permease subunit
MNALIWKEWRQNRIMIVWSAVLTVALAVADLIGERIKNSTAVPDAGELVGLVFAVGSVSAIVCGSLMISPEIGSGSLALLSVLPITRARVWCAKVGFGICLAAACLAATHIAYALLLSAALKTGQLVPDAAPPILVSLMSYESLVVFYAIGVAAGAVFDRTISAFMASLIMSAITFASFVSAAGLLSKYASRYEIVLEQTLMALLICLFFAASYAIFTRGETLRTSKRFRLAAEFGIPAAVIAGAIAIVHAVFIG